MAQLKAEDKIMIKELSNQEIMSIACAKYQRLANINKINGIPNGHDDFSEYWKDYNIFTDKDFKEAIEDYANMLETKLFNNTSNIDNLTIVSVRTPIFLWNLDGRVWNGNEIRLASYCKIIIKAFL